MDVVKGFMSVDVPKPLFYLILCLGLVRPASSTVAPSLLQLTPLCLIEFNILSEDISVSSCLWPQFLETFECPHIVF